MLFDEIESFDANGRPDGPFQANRDAIAAARIQALCHGRAHGKLMHNKFFVLSQSGHPKAVWTGSTNLTDNGIFGHSNLGHIVENKAIAQAFLAYWTRLSADPEVKPPYRDQNVAVTATPPNPWARHRGGFLAPGDQSRRAELVRVDRRRCERRPVHDVRVRDAREVQGCLPGRMTPGSGWP